MSRRNLSHKINTRTRRPVRKPSGPPPQIPNIFDSGIKLPDTVYVVATGQQGKDYYHKIPPDAVRVGVNGALGIGIPLTYYMAFDINSPDQPWWDLPLHGATTIFGFKIACDPRCDFYFDYYPAMHPAGVMKPYDMLPRILRGGASISACAMQFAYFFGAKRIVLVGVDMGGTKHWDGSGVGRAGRPRWSAADKIEMMFAGMMRDKEKFNPAFEGVYSMSPTQLKVKSWPITR